MNENIQKILDQLSTDVSGKWICRDQAERLIWLVIDECGDRMESTMSEREVPRPTWHLYEHFGRDWRDHWLADNKNIWRRRQE
jgi:hypothetical protein